MQQHLFRQPYLKTPLRYFGGKNLGTAVLLQFIPTHVKAVVSPFFGSGALELALTGRGVHVYGYDVFAPIPHFWNTLQAHPDAVVAQIRRWLRASSAETLFDEAQAAYAHTTCDSERAALCILIYNASFNGAGFRSGTRGRLVIEDDRLYINHRDGNYRTLMPYPRLEGFYNPYLHIGEADFRESLAKHPDMFAYCDPPYPDTGSVYGETDAHHKDFPHDALASILHARKDWVLSYNDVPTVRELYPVERFVWHRVQWHQGARKKGEQKGNDVVIMPASTGGSQ